MDLDDVPLKPSNFKSHTTNRLLLYITILLTLILIVYTAFISWLWGTGRIQITDSGFAKMQPNSLTVQVTIDSETAF